MLYVTHKIVIPNNRKGWFDFLLECSMIVSFIFLVGQNVKRSVPVSKNLIRVSCQPSRKSIGSCH